MVSDYMETHDEEVTESSFFEVSPRLGAGSMIPTMAEILLQHQH